MNLLSLFLLFIYYLAQHPIAGRIVCRQTAPYQWAWKHLPSDAGNVSRLNDECKKASFSFTFSNTDQHIYFYEQNRPGYMPGLCEQTHMYCAKVK